MQRGNIKAKRVPIHIIKLSLLKGRTGKRFTKQIRPLNYSTTFPILLIFELSSSLTDTVQRKHGFKVVSIDALFKALVGQGTYNKKSVRPPSSGRPKTYQEHAGISVVCA